MRTVNLFLRYFSFQVATCFLTLNVAGQSKAFVEVSKEAGIIHQFDVHEGFFGGGAVAFDYNNDGWEDLFLSGGSGSDMLYKNKGNGTFENVYDRSGLKTAVKYIAVGAVSADVNKDGWRDLFIVTINSSDNKEKIPRAPNLLFINNGDGTFHDATTEFGLDRYYSFTTAAMFGDVNNDGYPDLYVGNYFKEFSGRLDNITDEVIVGAKQMAKGYLLINQEGKSFEDRYDEYGMSHKGYGFGGVFSDFDNDGDLDLLINHDFGYKNTPNKFMKNMYPDRKFIDVSQEMKMNIAINAMGTAVGDFNNDGLMDYYITNIKNNAFMVNQGSHKPFLNESQKLGTRFPTLYDHNGSYMAVGWGANFADFDNDGDLDLFVANGCLNPYVQHNPDMYFENTNFKFINKSVEKNLVDIGISRGSITFDYDNDGDLDLLVVNQKPVGNTFPDAPGTRLFRNDSVSGNWLKVQLTGVRSDNNGIGSRIELVVGGVKMIREIDGGSSHSSQNSVIAHFGLANAKVVDTIKIRWLGGDEQILTKQLPNQLLKITEIPRSKHAVNWYWWMAAGIIILSLAFFFLRKKLI